MTDAGGGVLAQPAFHEKDMTRFVPAANNILLEAEEAMLEAGLGPTLSVHVEGAAGEILAVCGRGRRTETAADQGDGPPHGPRGASPTGPVEGLHLHLFVLLPPGGNVGKAKILAPRALGRLARRLVGPRP